MNNETKTAPAATSNILSQNQFVTFCRGRGLVISRFALNRWRKKGKLAPIKTVGRNIFYSESQFDEVTKLVAQQLKPNKKTAKVINFDAPTDETQLPKENTESEAADVKEMLVQFIAAQKNTQNPAVDEARKAGASFEEFMASLAGMTVEEYKRQREKKRAEQEEKERRYKIKDWAESLEYKIAQKEQDLKAEYFSMYPDDTSVQDYKAELEGERDVLKAELTKLKADNPDVFNQDTAPAADKQNSHREKPQQNSASTFGQPDAKETDGSEEDSGEEFIAVIPTDGSEDDDDELIDLPEGETLTPIIPTDPPQLNSVVDSEVISGEVIAADVDSENKKSTTLSTSQIDTPVDRLVAKENIDMPVDNLIIEGTAAPKKFLPMSIAPTFDKIPQVLKDLPRWLCWQLRFKTKPKKPNEKTKIPMTPKNGQLEFADVTNPDNWLTFDAALSFFNRGLCSGIGFALTNTPPKVCCVDVDHCFNSDGVLTDEAQSVIACCQNSFVEISQSGTGIHIWFIDDEFKGGRKKGNVETYAADRYIAVTGCHIEGTADNLLTVNGTCKTVINKFIDAREDNLFEESARAVEVKLPDATEFDSTLSDDDRRLIEFFYSDKCKERDPNLFELFGGNVDAYFKNTEKKGSKSEADEHLLLKLLFYIGSSGTDVEIAQRALRLFNQSELAKRDKWQREDYRERTLNAAFNHWVENGREARKMLTPPTDAGTSTLEALKDELHEAQKALAAFEVRKTSALEKLKNLETFDSDTVFSEEIILAAAVARLYDKQAFSNFRGDVKRYGDKHKDVKVGINDWLSEVKEKTIEIAARESALKTRINETQAQIDSLKFSLASDLPIPLLPDYRITPERGIEKVAGEKFIPICPRPVVISSQVFNVEEKTLKFRLAQMTASGKWKKLPVIDAATLSDSRAIIKLANDGLRVTSCNSNLLVEFFDKFRTHMEENLSTIYEVPRCGWYEFGGKEYFIDPRRPCVFSNDDDENISVEVDARSQFARCLTTAGSLDEWKQAYNLAKPYPVARFMVAASIAAPLLKVLGERNFNLFIFGNTRGGKSTAAILGASAVGSEKMIRSFDATKNGLAGAAADVNDFAFIVDEKQVADNRLKDSFHELNYALANGIGRTKLNKDSTLKKLQDWRTIAIMTGETRMFEDTMGGGDTRLLSVNAPKTIIPPDVCKQIRAIVKKNFGLAFPLVADKIFELGFELLQEGYEDVQRLFSEDYPDCIPEHNRYIALITLADAILNSSLGSDFADALTDAAAVYAKEIFSLIPTTADLDDTTREIDFVRDFVGTNQNQFISLNNKAEFIHGGIFGKLCDNYIYIAVDVLKPACQKAGFDYGKLVDDLIDAGFFAPADTIEKGRKTPLKTVKTPCGAVSKRCYRIKRTFFDSNE